MTRTRTYRRMLTALTALTALVVLAGACAADTTSAVRSSTAGNPAPSTPAAATTSVPSTGSAPDPLLPDEGGRSSGDEFTDWVTDRTRERAWLLDPCQPTAYPTDRQRERFRTVSREGPEVQDARQLGVYPTAEVAAEVLAGFRRALAACRTGQVDGIRWTWVSEDVPLGDDGFLAAGTHSGAQYAAHGARVAVTRAGNSVFLAYAGGEYSTAALDGGAQQMRAVAQRFLDSL